jgi:hypothetical protein
MAETPTQAQIDQARTQLKTWARDAKSDPGKMQKLKSDPVSTLQAAGVPEFAVGDFLKEEGIEAEVGAYARCLVSCVCSSCCISG